MSNRATHRFDMGSRVQTFGKDHSADFAAGSKAAGHFASLAQFITDLDSAKEVLLDALRLDLQNIARTAEAAGGKSGGRQRASSAIDAQQPGFADKFRTLATLRDTLLPKLLSGELKTA